MLKYYFGGLEFFFYFSIYLCICVCVLVNSGCLFNEKKIIYIYTKCNHSTLRLRWDDDGWMDKDYHFFYINKHVSYLNEFFIFLIEIWNEIYIIIFIYRYCVCVCGKWIKIFMLCSRALSFFITTSIYLFTRVLFFFYTLVYWKKK